MNEPAILFVSKPAETGERMGYTHRFNALTMEHLEVIDDRPFCRVVDGVRVNTKYIPEYEDLQINVLIQGGGGDV